MTLYNGGWKLWCLLELWEARMWRFSCKLKTWKGPSHHCHAGCPRCSRKHYCNIFSVLSLILNSWLGKLSSRLISFLLSVQWIHLNAPKMLSLFFQFWKNRNNWARRAGWGIWSTEKGWMDKWRAWLFLISDREPVKSAGNVHCESVESGWLRLLGPPPATLPAWDPLLHCWKQHPSLVCVPFSTSLSVGCSYLPE